MNTTMKHYLILSLLALLTVGVQAQESQYHPIAKEGKVWVGRLNNKYSQMNGYSTVSFFIQGDTLIDNHLCKKVWSQLQDEGKTAPVYHSAIHEENQQVFIYYANKTQPTLLCDFSAKVGDLFTIKDYYGSWQVEKIDTFYAAGQPLKRLYLNNTRNNNTEIWIEGVGPQMMWDYRKGNTIYSFLYFTSCIEDDKEICTYSDFDKKETSSYQPILVDGKVWHHSYKNPRFPENNYTFSFSVKCDTVIGGLKHYRLYGHNVDNDRTDKYLATLFEVDKRVFYWSLYLGRYGESLLYDFNLSAGERFQNFYADNYACNAPVDVVEAKGVRRRCIGMELREGSVETGCIGYWVEGIGSNALFYESYRWRPSGYIQLDSCTVKGEVIFTQDDFPALNSDSPELRKADYHPMFSEGKTWNYVYQVLDEGTWTYTQTPIAYVIKGDTVVSGKKYVKMYQEMSGSSTLCALWREEDQKVFYAQGNGEVLFFDYGAPYHGETSENGYLQSTEIISAQDDLFTRYRTINESYGYDGVWFDGIGGVSGLINGMVNTNGEGLIFSSCEENGKVIFSREDRWNEAISYRPFIEDGKVWHTGINPGNGFLKRYEYRLFGDTIIDGKTCRVLGRSELKFNAYSYTAKDTVYAGALYEEGHKVYGAKPGMSHLELLYDFESPVGTDVEINGDTFTITGREKSKDDTFKGIYTYIQIQGGTEETVPYWMEGVGGHTSPMESVLGFYPTGLMNEILISCSLGDEVIYMRDKGIPTDAEVKKQWLDFTHTVKTRPKAPGRMENEKGKGNNEEEGMNNEKADSEQDLTGEYSARELFVNLKTLSGTYDVMLKTADGQQVYHKIVQTNSVVALCTDLTKYAEGTYTLTIENSDEAYTATFTLPLDGTGVRDLSHPLNPQRSTLNRYDLTGRRFAAPPSKGIYIENGRKKVVNKER